MHPFAAPGNRPQINLDDRAVADFRADGAIVLRNVFNAEWVAAMRTLTAEVMAKQVSAAEADLADAKPGEAQRKATEVLNQLKALQSTL